VTVEELRQAEAVCAGNALSLRPVSAIDGYSLPSLNTP